MNELKTMELFLQKHRPFTRIYIKIKYDNNIRPYSLMIDKTDSHGHRTYETYTKKKHMLLTEKPNARVLCLKTDESTGKRYMKHQTFAKGQSEWMPVEKIATTPLNFMMI